MQLIRGQPDWRLTDRQHHEAFSGETAILDELPLVGRMHLLDALPNALVPHAHPGIYEAHFVVGGSLGFRAREQDFEVNEGMVFLTKPGEVHSGIDTTLQPAEWFWIHIHFPENQALQGLTVRETREMEEAYSRTSLCLFPGSDHLKDAFNRLLDEHRSPGEHSQLIARATLHELMVSLIRDHDRVNARSTAASLSAEVRQALAWLDQNIGQPLSIPDLAAASGLSQSHFRQRFHKETGFTPSDYLTRRRILRAKQLLQGKRLSITEIAFRLGFQSSPYFAAVFKKLTGMTPSEYREHIHANPDAR
ncbi:MAG: helix-turn-helix transcriptional regulator [Anaerolineae bacterium]|nr:helix-turn-helix transcriptional regulator [Phycisphaerae bacterium]